MVVVQTRQCSAKLKMFINNSVGKGIYYQEIGKKKVELVLQHLVKNVNTAGTDEYLFRLVPRVLPLELVLVPGHGAQISVWASTKGYVQTGAVPRLQA